MRREISKKHAAALRYGENGWKVFPVHSVRRKLCTCSDPDCENPGKHPRITEWPSKATASKITISGWWRQWRYANIAVVTGTASHLVVIDIDSEAAFQDLKNKYPEVSWDKIPTAKTGRGFHLFFKFVGEPIRTRTGVLPQIDIRGEGGYVVVPPSKHITGKTYTWIIPPDSLAVPPEPLRNLLLDNEPLEVTSVERNNDWVQELLQGVEEGRRNDSTARLAGHFLGKNISPEETLAVLDLWNGRNSPPLDPAEIKAVVNSVYRTRLRDSNNLFPFSPYIYPGERGESIPSPPLISSADLAKLTETDPIEWLLDGLVPRAAVVGITGLPGAYKTFFGLCLAVAVAKGERFLERSVRQGSVLYVDKETPKALLASRISDIGVSEKLEFWPLWTTPEPPFLGHPVYLDVASNRQLIIFDSFRRFHTKSENLPEEMAELMAHIRALTKNGATVLLLHHAGKAEGSLYRGSTEILAGLDVAFSFERVKGQELGVGGPVSLRMRCIKHRFIQEPLLSLQFLSADGRYLFRDQTEQDQRERESEDRKKMREICRVLQELTADNGPPNQSKLVERLKSELHMSKKIVFALLKQGEGEFWKSERRGGTRLYFPLLS